MSPMNVVWAMGLLPNAQVKYGNSPRTCSNSHHSDDLRDYHNLARAYIVGDKLDDVVFKDAVIDAFIAKSHDLRDGVRGFPVGSLTTFVYSNTTQDAMLR
jgi:hypothetical protein